MRETLSETLRQLDGQALDGDHPTPGALASWLDDVASPAASEAIELHLASCRDCRDVVADVADIQAIENRRRWLRRGIQSALAVAALLLISFGTWFLVSWDDRLDELGVAKTAALTELTLVAQMRSALDGQWPSLAFSAFEDASGRVSLRGAEAPRTPEPLMPRWSAVRSARPWLRVEGIDEALQALVVDAEEKVVASFEIAAGSIEFPWPEDQADLLPGVYAWKVSVLNLDIAAASAWVPFKVLDARESARLDSQVEGREGLPAALILARFGLLEEASARLGAIEDRATRQQLQEGLVRLRGLPPELERSELEAARR